MRKNNYEDPKTHEKFYKTIKDGKTFYSKRFRDKNDGTGKQQWTPLLPSIAKVNSYIRDVKEKNLIFATEHRTLYKHKFRDVYDECYEHMKQEYILEGRSPQTVGKFMSNISKYVLEEPDVAPMIADKNVEDLVINDIKAVKKTINKKYGYKLAKGTISGIFSNIDRVFLYARDCGFVSNAFCTEMIVSASGKKQTSKQAVRNFMSEKEYQIFIKTYDENIYDIRKRNNRAILKDVKAVYDMTFVDDFYVKVYRLFFTSCVYLGSRKNEIRGLRWSDIIYPTDDYPLFQMKIDSQYSETYASLFDKEAYTLKPKTDSSVRIVTVNQVLSDELKMFCQFLRRHDMFDENQYIFFDYFSRSSKPLPKSSIQRLFDEILNLSGIEENSIELNGVKRNITIHGLRHSACAILLEKGMPVVEVAKHLGHKDTKMVEYVYSHFINPCDMEEEKKKRNISFFLSTS